MFALFSLKQEHSELKCSSNREEWLGMDAVFKRKGAKLLNYDLKDLFPGF